VIQRSTRAGLPLDLIPANITSITVSADVDAENALRTAVLEFMNTVRVVEKAVAADRRVADTPAKLDVAAVGAITEDEWRACWPSADEAEPEPEPVTEESAVEDAEAPSDDPEKD
jgi:XTP/dITP diphosphohydrolase